MWRTNYKEQYLPTVQETQVQTLGQEDPLEKENDNTHSSILAWKIPWTEQPGGLQSMGSQELDNLKIKPLPYIYFQYNIEDFLIGKY